MLRRRHRVAHGDRTIRRALEYATRALTDPARVAQLVGPGLVGDVVAVVVDVVALLRLEGARLLVAGRAARGATGCADHDTTGADVGVVAVAGVADAEAVRQVVVRDAITVVVEPVAAELVVPLPARDAAVVTVPLADAGRVGVDHAREDRVRGAADARGRALVRLGGHILVRQAVAVVIQAIALLPRRTFCVALAVGLVGHVGHIRAVRHIRSVGDVSDVGRDVRINDIEHVGADRPVEGVEGVPRVGADVVNRPGAAISDVNDQHIRARIGRRGPGVCAIRRAG